jgi:hypothetical protein
VERRCGHLHRQPFSKLDGAREAQGSGGPVIPKV